MVRQVPAGSAAAAPRVASGPTRDRLLDAAGALFYREGVGVGVEAVCRAAGVSKRSMYQLFESKDDVVAASLDRSGFRYAQSIIPADDDRRPPRARILYVFERLEEQAAAPDFRGCPFVSTAVELKSPGHPASLVARKYKDAMTSFFEREAERGGAQDPSTLARQLTVVFDGASARAVVQGDELHGLAVATAGALLDQAGLTA